MSAKLGFAAGLAVGLLVGSRAGRGLYDRSVATASAVVHDPRVRSGATSVVHKAGSAGSSAAGAAARKVKNRGKSGGEGDAADGSDGSDGERAPAALRGRTKRLIGGVRKHGVRVNGHGTGMKISRPHIHRWNHADHSHNGSRHVGHAGMTAPYVQPKPKDNGGEDDWQDGD